MKKIICLITALMMITCSFTGCSQEPAEDPKPFVKTDFLFANLKADAADYYRQLGEFAVSDVVDNFWLKEENHVLPTWNGFPYYEDTEGRDPRGSMWETGQCLYGIYDMYVVTGSNYYKNLLEGQAKFIKNSFTAEELMQAGGNENWATDDCFWNTQVYLIMYDITGDKWFIDVAAGLLDSAKKLWGDDVTGGGMWYNNDRNRKSTYEVGAAMSWFSLWKKTGEQKYYDLSLESYEWMHKTFSQNRSDGLYFIEADAYGPIGGEEHIAEGGSSSFLTANMGLAALAVMFYNETGDKAYLDRAYAVCDGLLLRYNDDGVLLDDRDAWTNGAYASYFASYVLTLPDTDEIRKLCQATATSVVKNDRTPDGYYGGTWKGPSEGSLSIWYCGGSVARQSSTTGTAVSMVTSMAVHEAGIRNYLR